MTDTRRDGGPAQSGRPRTNGDKDAAAVEVSASVPTTDAEAWAEALADPAFVAALEEGLADLAAGRVTPWEIVKARLASSSAPTPAPETD